MSKTISENDENQISEMNKKKAVWAVVSFLIAVGSIVLILKKSKTFQLDEFLFSIRHLDGLWMILALISMFGFIWFEGMAILRIAKTLNLKKKLQEGMVYGAADVYFSAITPSASGGQPASAYFMMQDGMNASAVAIILLFNLIFYCAALLSVGAVSFVLYGKILFQLSVKFKILYGIGFIVLIVLAGMFYLLINQGKIIYRIYDWFLSAGEKMHVIRNGQKRRKKMLNSMDHYHKCACIIAKDRKIIGDVFFWNVLQRLSQLGVSFCIFMAWKKDLLLAFKAVAVQCFVAVGSNSVPIPGGMGVADYLMINGFTHLLGEGMAVNMELICRGITFYGCVITGGIITLTGYIMRRKRKQC